MTSLPGNFRWHEVTWSRFLSRDCLLLRACRKLNEQYTQVLGLLQPLLGDFRSNDVASVFPKGQGAPPTFLAYLMWSLECIKFFDVVIGMHWAISCGRILGFPPLLKFPVCVGGNTGNNINSAIMLLVSTTHRAEPTAQYQPQIMSQLQRKTQHTIQLSIHQLYTAFSLPPNSVTVTVISLAQQLSYSLPILTTPHEWLIESQRFSVSDRNIGL